MIKNFLKFLKSNDFKEFLITIILGMVIIGLCVLIFKFPVKASGTENSVYFPMEQNKNGLITESYQNWIFNILDGNNNYIFIKYIDSSSSQIRVNYILQSKTVGTCQFYGEIASNGYYFSIYRIGNDAFTVGMLTLKSNNTYTNTSLSNNLSPFQNLPSNNYSNIVDYISNFRILTNNGDNASTVLKYGWELPPDFMHDTSHATPPDTYESPVYTIGHTPPTNVPPTYTINNYTWTTYTPPTLDTSNAEKLLESIYNAIVYNGQYLKDNLHGELTNLVNNIGGFIEFIGDTIQYYGNLIISNIQNGITTFYNNINSAIVGIGDAVGYITQPLDMDNLTNAVNSTHIWGDVDTCTSYANDAFGIYGTVAEPNTFKIPLDLRSISLLNITQVYYIDLSWLDGAKQAIRAFMWCVVTFGLLYSVIVDIPNMIRSSK